MVDAIRAMVKTMLLMKSVRYHGAGDIRVEEISESICGREEFLVSLFLSHLMLNADGGKINLHLLEYAVVVCLIFHVVVSKT